MICLIRSNGECLDVSTYDAEVMVESVKDLLACRDYPSVNDCKSALMAVTRSYLRGRGLRVTPVLTAIVAGELAMWALARSRFAGEPDRWLRWLERIAKGDTVRSTQDGPRAEPVHDPVDGFKGTAYKISETAKLLVSRGGLLPGSAVLISLPREFFTDLGELNRYIVSLWEAVSHAMSTPGGPEGSFIQSQHAGEAIRELEQEFKESLESHHGGSPQ